MDLARPLEASTLGANLCVEGIPEFSQLPRGSRLRFPSGAALVVEETNPPCAEMGAEIEAAYTTSADEPAAGKMFGKHSIGLRGVVGVVDVPGEIRTGDRVSSRSSGRPASIRRLLPRSHLPRARPESPGPDPLHSGSLARKLS